MSFIFRLFSSNVFLSFDYCPKTWSLKAEKAEKKRASRLRKATALALRFKHIEGEMHELRNRVKELEEEKRQRERGLRGVVGSVSSVCSVCSSSGGGGGSSCTSTSIDVSLRK